MDEFLFGQRIAGACRAVRTEVRKKLAVFHCQNGAKTGQVMHPYSVSNGSMQGCVRRTEKSVSGEISMCPPGKGAAGGLRALVIRVLLGLSLFFFIYSVLSFSNRGSNTHLCPPASETKP